MAFLQQTSSLHWYALYTIPLEFHVDICTAYVPHAETLQGE